MWIAAMLKAGAVAGLMLAAAPAFAQDAEEQARIAEMSCVYSGVTELSDDDFFAIGDMVIENLSEGPEFERLTEMVTDATDACASTHKWDEKRIGYALEVGMQGVVSDTLATDLIDFGLTEEQLRKVDGLLDTMSDENFNRLYYGTWRQDASARAELEKMWLAIGIPQEAAILERLPVYMEASIVALDIIDQWMEEFPL